MKTLRGSRSLAVLAVITTAAMAVMAVMSACSSKSSLVGPGGECFLADDCAPGLVCIQQENKASICSDDLSRVAGKPPPEGGVADADVADGEGGAQTDSPVTPKDATPQDTGTPPVDSGQTDN